MELVDTLALGASADKACWFESSRGHQNSKIGLDYFFYECIIGSVEIIHKKTKTKKGNSL